MNATVRLAAPRHFAAPLACTLPAPSPARVDETEICIHTLELIERLVDALLSSFALTEYEEQVVHHMLFGRSCHAIGRRLGIRETTVHKYMHKVFAKTNTQDRRGLYDLGLRLAAVRAITGASTRERLAA